MNTPEEFFKVETKSVLTSREIEIIELVCQGWNNKYIADRFVVSLRTIHSHLNHIYEKIRDRFDCKNKDMRTVLVNLFGEKS